MDVIDVKMFIEWDKVEETKNVDLHVWLCYLHLLQYFDMGFVCSSAHTQHVAHSELLKKVLGSIKLHFSSPSSFIPVAPTWSIGHPWNASFHCSFLI
jgi:hypothetical protein